MDTRRKLENYEVRNRTAYIYVENDNYKGQIENLKHATGTGSVIGENYILTAGHVIYSNNYPKGYLTGGYVSPGRNAGNEKFGRYKIKAMHVMPQYIESPLQRHDIGIIEVEPHDDNHESISKINRYNIKPFKKKMLGKKIESQGYPIDLNEESIDQYWGDGTIIQKQPKGTVELSMYAYSGQSGSPIILEGTDDVIGVFTYATKGIEYGTLMTPITHEIYNWIQSIINKDGKVDDPTNPAEQPKADDTKQAVKATQINNTEKKVTATQVSTSHGQNKAQLNAKHDKKQLPYTGENEVITTTLFGTLFAVLGSLLFFRKSKTDK